MFILQSIIIGIITHVLIEFGKSLKKFIASKIYIRSLQFSIEGYWCTYHEQTSEDKVLYQAYELIKMSINKDKLFFRLYQYTEDKRFYLYKGCAYFRNNKIALSYEEVNNAHSNYTGTFNLQTGNDDANHKIILKGVYSEFLKDSAECKSNNYSLYEYNISKKDKFLILLFKSHYIKKLMKKEDFKNECKKMH